MSDLGKPSLQIAAPIVGSVRRHSRLARREAIDGYIFILPWLLGFILWVAGPMATSLVLSFTRWNLFAPPQWVGLANFGNLFSNKMVGISLYNTAYYTFLAVPFVGAEMAPAEALHE